jgi:exopolysaccharide biosynthesis polyprenyl glycosylphosphotransferase
VFTHSNRVHPQPRLEGGQGDQGGENTVSSEVREIEAAAAVGAAGGLPGEARTVKDASRLKLAHRSTRGQAPVLAESLPSLAVMRRNALLRRMLLAADVTAVMGAFLLTVELPSRSLGLTWAIAAALPIVLLGAKVSGLYDRDEALLHKTTLDEAPTLFQVATLCALVTWLSGGLIVAGSLNRREAIFLWLALSVLLILGRAGARTVALRLAPAERCLFIGDRAAANLVASKLSGSRGVKAELVGYVDGEEVAQWSTEGCSQHRLTEIRTMVAALDVQRAILAPESIDGAIVLDLVRTLKAVGVRVSVLPQLLEVVGSSVQFDDLHGVMLMGVRRFDLTRSSAGLKRAFDLLGASIGLLAVLPLMIAISIAIKLDSDGPIFFRQLRVGRRGERFHMLKFRTMVPDAEQLKDSLRDRNEAKEGLFKIVDDPRITRVGAILRKSALDELPQLLNILRGEMSLVGPRPLVLDEDERIAGWDRQRLELLPGMTGHWQILGPARVPLSEMVAIDYLYVANWSLWTDVKILLRTVPHVLGRHGL